MRRLELAATAIAIATGLLWQVSLAAASTAVDPADKGWLWHDNRFSADLLVTNEHDELVRQWGSAGRHPGQWPNVPMLESARRGEKVHAVVVFAGCLSPEGHPCVMRMDFSMIRPDGSRYGAFADADLWSETSPPPDPKVVNLAGPYIEFMAEPDDPLGTYTIVVRIRSPTTAEGIELRRTLDVVPGP
jgi:hypothetical protein